MKIKSKPRSKNPIIWSVVQSNGKYIFWKRLLEGGAYIYNVTTNGKPPTTKSGYYNLQHLLKTKKAV